MEGDELDALARRRVGTVLREKWRLDRLLGVGGMAAVYAGTHRNGSRGAIKILHPELARVPEVKTRFLREGYAANTVGHPGSVKVLDDDTAEDGTVFLVLEMLEGVPLDRVAARGPLDPKHALYMCRELLAVLAAAHARGIIHRDIKPENLFVCRDGHLKLLDFGIARLADNAQTTTRTGVAMGTPAYMAPEQALGRTREIDARTDLFSVGAVLYALLSGRTPHDAESGNELLVKVATQPAPPLQSVRPDLPAPIAAVVDRTLSYARDQRPSSAAELAEMLLGAQNAVYGTISDEATRAEIARLAQAAPVASTQPMSDTQVKEALSMLQRGTVMGGSGTQAGAPSHVSGTAYAEPQPLLRQYASAPGFSSGSQQGIPAPPPPKKGMRGWMIALVLIPAGAAAVLVGVRALGPGILASNGADASTEAAAVLPESPNRFIAITPRPAALGVPNGHAMQAPTSPYEMQEHEVTWSEIGPWLSKKNAPLEVPGDADDLPVTGISWDLARAYCKESFQGDLPTEEQWEYAARRAELRRFPWGDEDPDWSRTHAFDGPDAKVVKVKSSDQDKTPEGIYDLAGNAQEWTVTLWRSDVPGADDSFAQSGGHSARTIRGWPLARKAPAGEIAITWRDWACATGNCADWAGPADAAPPLQAARLSLAAAGGAKPLAKEAQAALLGRDGAQAIRDCLEQANVKMTSFGVKASKGFYCQSPGVIPNQEDPPWCQPCEDCEGYNASYGPMLTFTGNKTDAVGKCLDGAVRKIGVKGKLPPTMADGEESFEASITKPSEQARTIGFRCVRHPAH